MSLWLQILGIPFSIDSVDAGGIATRRLRAGAGKAVIFLHGVGGHLEGFIPAVPHFASHFEVHLLDMLGHGFTDKSHGPLTVDRTADHITRYMDATGLSTAHIVGQSLGAWTAAWLAAHHPERIDSVVLTAAAGSPIAGFADPRIGEMARANNKQGMLEDTLEQTRTRLGTMVRDPTMITEEFARIRHNFYEQPAFRQAVDDLMALTHTDHFDRYCLRSDVLAKIKSEVLLLWGDEKIETNPNCPTFLLDGIARTKLVVMKNCGHWPPFERPEDYARIAVPFLQRGLDSVQVAEI